MALTEIGARLRLAGAPAFSRDAGKGADSLGRLAREAGQADRKVSGLERAAKRSRSALGSIAKGAAFGAIGVAAAGVGALSVGLIQGFKDAASLQTMLAKTNAVVKSTGGVANVSAASVLKMSDQLEALSTIDQEAILNGQNLLLTFTNVRNGVKQTDKIFDQASQTLVDMASALGSDPQSAAIQLGKALNDPVKGVTALSKVGVSFTAQQKAQIKTLVASGRTMEAQKVILKELNTEFGGAAKAAGSGFEGSLFRAKDALGDLFRDVATPLLPGFTAKVEELSTFLSGTATPAILGFVKGFQDNTGAGGEFRDNLLSLRDAARDAIPFIQSVFEKTKQVIEFVAAHPDAFKVLAAGVATYAAAMKAAAVASAAMALAGPGAARGIAATGTAAGGAAVGFGAWALPLAAAAASLTALYLALKRASDDPQQQANLRAGSPTATIGKQPPLRNPDGSPGRVTVAPGVVATMNGPRPFAPSPRVGTRYGSRGGRRWGGSVVSGQPYLVGEREPEVFTPNVSGRVSTSRQYAAAHAAPSGPSRTTLVIPVMVNGREITTATIENLEDRMARR